MRKARKLQRQGNVEVYEKKREEMPEAMTGRERKRGMMYIIDVSNEHEREIK